MAQQNDYPSIDRLRANEANGSTNNWSEYRRLVMWTLEEHDKDIKELQEKHTRIMVKVAYISGGIGAAAGILVHFVFK